MSEIDKNTPIPERNKKYPIGELEVGDSFETTIDNVLRLRGAVSFYKRTHPGTNFTTRSIGTDKVRVWRVA